MGVCFASAQNVVGQKHFLLFFLVNKLSKRNSILEFAYLSLSLFKANLFKCLAYLDQLDFASSLIFMTSMPLSTQILFTSRDRM